MNKCISCLSPLHLSELPQTPNNIEKHRLYIKSFHTPSTVNLRKLYTLMIRIMGRANNIILRRAASTDNIFLEGRPVSRSSSVTPSFYVTEPDREWSGIRYVMVKRDATTPSSGPASSDPDDIRVSTHMRNTRRDIK